ncbi:SDR family NAD(P)-dependent oxidoreductase [Nocardioides alkalitolerans]|uniref:SDR family NAD(P)-dependent oxidoreductase n=1 Tax=Nocardioides alkalitolerans TaxID=281714 RepID=UPI0003F9177D|nr:SDR family NAD(P)-dependent oxidoreductase [Nocardioides alkalitolerans]
MQMKLDNKVVVVTGAARGQGAAEVEALAREGATVVATDVLDEDGTTLAKTLTADGLDVAYRSLDVRSAPGWEALAAELGERYGAVHGLVNNAGVAARERLPHVSLDAWERTFAINVTGPMLGIQALVPLMGPGASIVNICSVAAMAGHAAAAYTSSKWALRGLTRTASLELGARGIRVNAVMPGLVDTPLMASASPAFHDAALAEIPLGRIGLPADIAPTIVFLLSDDSAYYNGAELVIDGGLTAHVSHKGIADATRPTTPEGPR